MVRSLVTWARQHPVRAGALAGWYQQAAGGIGTLAVIALANDRLSNEQAGVWFTFQGLLGIVALTDFGIGFCIARQTAYSLTDRGSEMGGDLLATRIGWQGVADVYAASTVLFRRVQIASAVVLVAIYHLVLPHTRLLAGTAEGFAFAWYALGVAVILALRARQDISVMEGIGCVHIARFLSGTYFLLAGVGAAVGIITSGRLDVMSIGVLMASLVYWLATRIVLHKIVEVDVLRTGHAGSLPGGLWRSAVSMGIVNTGQWLVSVAQVPLIGTILGPEKVAPFYAAQKIGQLLNTAALQFVGPQLPLFTQALARDDKLRATERLRRTVTTQVAIALAVNLVFFAIGPIIATSLLNSPSYVDLSTRAILSIDYTLMSSSVVAAHFVLASGRNPFLWTTLGAGVINIVIAVTMAPRYGVLAIALGGLCGGLATNYWFAFVEEKRLLRRLT